MSPGSAPTDARVNNGVNDVSDLRDLHGDVRKLMVAIGDLKTQIEKDQEERRALKWAQAPLWLLAVSGALLAGCELYARIHAG